MNFRIGFMGIAGLIGLLLLLAATASAIDEAVSTLEGAHQVSEIAP